MAVFSRGGHSTWILIADGRRSPACLPVTDAERIALYNTGFYGSGTYKIDGDKVSFLYNTSFNQAWTGSGAPTDHASLRQGPDLDVSANQDVGRQGRNRNIHFRAPRVTARGAARRGKWHTEGYVPGWPRHAWRWLIAETPVRSAVQATCLPGLRSPIARPELDGLCRVRSLSVAPATARAHPGRYGDAGRWGTKIANLGDYRYAAA